MDVLKFQFGLEKLSFIFPFKWHHLETRVKKNKQGEHVRNKLSQKTIFPRVNEKFITQVFEEIEQTVTKKLSQELSRTKSQILNTSSKLFEFFLKSQVRVQSGTAPEALRIFHRENQEFNEDRLQNDPHPEVGTLVNKSSHSVNLDFDLVHLRISRAGINPWLSQTHGTDLQRFFKKPENR